MRPPPSLTSRASFARPHKGGGNGESAAIVSKRRMNAASTDPDFQTASTRDVPRAVIASASEAIQQAPRSNETILPSFRDGPKDQTRNLEILRCAIAHRSSMLRI